MKKLPILFLLYCLFTVHTAHSYTHADTLRGSDGRGRDWWDIQKYELNVKGICSASGNIDGSVKISFNVIATPHDSMQLDLQEPMILDKVLMEGKEMNVAKEGNVWWIKYPFHKLAKGKNYSIKLSYHGVPIEAAKPPWQGGFIRGKDSTGKTWVTVTSWGIGASLWWPCKDMQWDEPDSGMELRFTVPRDLQCISNGRLIEKKDVVNGVEWLWKVKSPMSNYDATCYIGDYVHFHDTLLGEDGNLDLDFYALRYNEQKAREQFSVTKQMIHCFEYWAGPYPFYDDGYKIVEAPYLGMSYQSAIGYGNNYQMGYLGTDRSQTGLGMKFDFIIIHESAHCWFSSNITVKDVADDWIHEGFTTYMESLFLENISGKKDGASYCRGEWVLIKNEHPLIGDYGVNNKSDEDIYSKGAAIVYMIRVLMNDDNRFRMMLRGMNKHFYHQTVIAKQIETYIADHSGLDLTAFFNQYLRTNKIPEIEYVIKDNDLSYRFNNIVDGFTIPIITITSTDAATKTTAIASPTAEWQHIQWDGSFDVKISNDFLVKVKK